eukprot:GHVU01146387.1.p1 GENE.GHVU01146387.1~~GHVU01146387.1.p1  ORF type:complete len:129 (+),score=1.19 GHVU01146387.1:178-564(+)
MRVSLLGSLHSLVRYMKGNGRVFLTFKRLVYVKDGSFDLRGVSSFELPLVLFSTGEENTQLTVVCRYKYCRKADATLLPATTVRRLPAYKPPCLRPPIVHRVTFVASGRSASLLWSVCHVAAIVAPGV